MTSPHEDPDCVPTGHDKSTLHLSTVLGLRLVTVGEIVHVVESQHKRLTVEPAGSLVVTDGLDECGDWAVSAPAPLSVPATQADVADPYAAAAVNHAKGLNRLSGRGSAPLAQTSPAAPPLWYSGYLTARLALQPVLLLLLLTGQASACCTRYCLGAQTASAAAAGCSRSGCWPAWALGPAPSSGTGSAGT